MNTGFGESAEYVCLALFTFGFLGGNGCFGAVYA